MICKKIINKLKKSLLVLKIFSRNLFHYPKKNQLSFKTKV